MSSSASAAFLADFEALEGLEFRLDPDVLEPVLLFVVALVTGVRVSGSGGDSRRRLVRGVFEGGGGGVVVCGGRDGGVVVVCGGDGRVGVVGGRVPARVKRLG